MSKKKIILFLIILVSFFIALPYIQNYCESLTRKNNDFYEISVICRERSMDNYSSIKAGIDQAADDFNAEINYITLSKNNDAAQQVSMIKQEVETGTNAIIILPADSIKDADSIKAAAREVPVIALQHPIEGLTNSTTISCDEVQLGRALTQKILQDEGHAKDLSLKIFRSSSHKDFSKLLSGITAVINNDNVDISYSAVPDDCEDAYAAVKTALMKCGNKTIVALDSDSLEAAGKAKKDLLKSGINVPEKIYGIGRTDTIVAMLEENIVQAIGVENEYGIGYLGVKMAIDGIQNKKIENNVSINFVISDKSNMYCLQNEYMLFPFINY